MTTTVYSVDECQHLILWLLAHAGDGMTRAEIRDAIDDMTDAECLHALAWARRLMDRLGEGGISDGDC